MSTADLCEAAGEHMTVAISHLSIAAIQSMREGNHERDRALTAVRYALLGLEQITGSLPRMADIPVSAEPAPVVVAPVVAQDIVAPVVAQEAVAPMGALDVPVLDVPVGAVPVTDVPVLDVPVTVAPPDAVLPISNVTPFDEEPPGESPTARDLRLARIVLWQVRERLCPLDWAIDAEIQPLLDSVLPERGAEVQGGKR